MTPVPRRRWEAPANWRISTSAAGVWWGCTPLGMPRGAPMSTATTASLGQRARFRRGLDSDGVLLRRAANGDDEAFETFYHQHADALLGYCQHLLGSRQEAEDAVQQSFFSAYREVTAGNLPDKPKAWLYAIARNRSLSTIRARREQAAELSDL